MRKWLGAALVALAIAGCADKQAETTPTPAATTPAPELDEHGHDLSQAQKKDLTGYSQGVRDYYGDTVPVGKTGEEQLDIEIEYHQPPDPPEAAIGEPITLTGTQIGVRLKVIVDKVEDLGKQTAVHLKLESTGITIHDDAFREATVTYSDGKTVKVEPKRVKCSNGFDGVVRLDVLRKTHGCLVFPKSGDAEPQQFQMALENVPVTAGGIWNLG
jgi:hypothetical protein